MSFDVQLKNLIYEVNCIPAADNPLACELIKNILKICGIPAERIVERREKQRTFVSAYVESKAAASELVKQLAAWHLKGVRVKVKVLPKKFWLERWKKDWKPFKLTRKIDVVPVWQQSKYKVTKRKFILLDTISAFGTGLHETTKFMSQIIESLEGEFEDVLDVGTGSGILTIVARYSGAQTLYALDISPTSVTTAQTNMKVNGIKANYLKAIDFRKFNPHRKFDLVAANLITHDLISMRRRILALVKKGKWLALSGISLENLGLLLKTYRQLPLKQVKILKGKKWAAVLYKKER